MVQKIVFLFPGPLLLSPYAFNWNQIIIFHRIESSRIICKGFESSKSAILVWKGPNRSWKCFPNTLVDQLRQYRENGPRSIILDDFSLFQSDGWFALRDFPFRVWKYVLESAVGFSGIISKVFSYCKIVPSKDYHCFARQKNPAQRLSIPPKGCRFWNNWKDWLGFSYPLKILLNSLDFSAKSWFSWS